ncbi:MAG: hypothetical protein JNJ54_25845 [Myxococcaceae bacterium]|nr:hypothetical protein [Myxococcaceae bacterium]
MQTSYDLVIQAEPGAPFDPAPVEAAIRERGGSSRGDGALVWRFAVGDVVTLPLREAGAVTGVELKIPFSDRLELLNAVVPAAVELARTLNLRVVDPQLARTVLDPDVGAVSDEFLRIARYAGQYYGIGDALPMAAVGPAEEGMSPAVKGLLALLVFAVAAAAAYQYFSPD